MNKFAACFAASSVVFFLTPENGPLWLGSATCAGLAAAFGVRCLIDAIREKP